jgi:hypothetical protein
MAESRRSKLRRWSKGDFTESDYQGIIGLLVFDQIVDVATGGKLSALKKKVGLKVVLPLVSGAGRLAGRAALGTASVAGRSALGAAAPIVTNPYVAGTALGYGALQTEMGQDLLEAAGERGRMDRIRFEQALTDLEVGVGKTKTKVKSKFNRAVGAGMKAAKNSVSYGKKGVISAPKKVFATVTKIASKINQNKKRGKLLPKAPKAKGPKAIYNAIKKVLK